MQCLDPRAGIDGIYRVTWAEGAAFIETSKNKLEQAGHEAVQHYIGDAAKYKYAEMVSDGHAGKTATYGRLPARCKPTLPGAIALAGAGPFVWVSCRSWGAILYPFSPTGLVAVTNNDPGRVTVDGNYLAREEIMYDQDWAHIVPEHRAWQVNFDPREGDICPEDPGVTWYSSTQLREALAALPQTD